METFQIMLVKVNHRMQKAPQMQEVFTKFGCSIKMRLGLHEAGDACSNEGLIVLQLVGNEEELASFQRELEALEGITTKRVSI